MRAKRLLGVGSFALAAGLAVSAILGPLVLEVIRYRTSDTTRSQFLGADAATLFIVAPVALIAGLLTWRGHRAGPVLALGPAIFAVYMLPQLVIGEEYLELAGNNERFFLLHLATFIVGGAVTVTAWRKVALTRPAVSDRLARFTGWALLFVAAFLVLGLHAPTLVDAWSDAPTRTEYLTTPTAFWLVKMMDLGIVAPVALATGVGLLKRREWASRLVFAMVGSYALLTTAVTGMAIAMQVTDDPDAQVANMIAFGVFSLFFLSLAVGLYRPLFRRQEPGGTGLAAAA